MTHLESVALESVAQRDGTAQDSEVERPAVSAPEPWSFPEAQRSVLANGLGVVSYDIPGQYVISVRLAVPMPLEREPREREGIATIMARTSMRERRAYRRGVRRVVGAQGIALGASASESGLIVDVDVPKRNLTEALDLLSQAVREPAFPANEVSRHVKIRLAEIDQERAMPGHERQWSSSRPTSTPTSERHVRPPGPRRRSQRSRPRTWSPSIQPTSCLRRHAGRRRD